MGVPGGEGHSLRLALGNSPVLVATGLSHGRGSSTLGVAALRFAPLRCPKPYPASGPQRAHNIPDGGWRHRSPASRAVRGGARRRFSTGGKELDGPREGHSKRTLEEAADSADSPPPTRLVTRGATSVTGGAFGAGASAEAEDEPRRGEARSAGRAFGVENRFGEGQASPASYGEVWKGGASGIIGRRLRHAKGGEREHGAHSQGRA